MGALRVRFPPGAARSTSSVVVDEVPEAMPGARHNWCCVE
tara:strand:+ start:110 stop:229 length:120 start_codon:yes stop_codon:yes gene_type:complete